MLSGRAVLGLGITILAASCATAPRWTPQSVAPPETPSPGFEQPAPLEKRTEPIVPPTASDAAQPVKLTRDGALLTAFLNNRTVQVARFGPSISETFVPEARAAFDPTVLASLAASHTEQDTLASSSTGAGATGNGQSGAQLPAAVQSIETSLSQLQKAILTLAGPTTQLLKVDTVTGSATVQETFPTGTQLSVSGNASSVDTNLLGDSHPGGWTVSLDQPLLRGAGLAVNLVALRQAKNTVAKSQYIFKGTVLGIVQQVELAYWNLVLATEVLKIREFAVKLADEQLKLNDELLKVGKAIEGDVMASRAEKATRQADLTDAQAAVRKQTVASIRLMNPKSAQPWKTTFEPVDQAQVVRIPVEADTSEKLSLQYRPELAQTKLDLANLDLALAQAKNGMLPRLDLVSSFSNSSSTGSGSAMSSLSASSKSLDTLNYQIGVQLSTPILYRAERARYRRAMLSARQGEQSLADLELSVASQVRQEAVEVERQWDRIGATQAALQNRTEQLRITQGRFDVGKVTNLDLLLVQRDLIQSRVDDATARVNYIQALTSLYAAEGTLLERRGISLETTGDSES